MLFATTTTTSQAASAIDIEMPNRITPLSFHTAAILGNGVATGATGLLDKTFVPDSAMNGSFFREEIPLLGKRSAWLY